MKNEEKERAAIVVSTRPLHNQNSIAEHLFANNSPVADFTNMGGPNAGQITAALFLAEFVADHPWAHLDIAGTAQLPEPRSWRNKGATGFGARLLIEVAMSFQPLAEREVTG